MNGSDAGPNQYGEQEPESKQAKQQGAPSDDKKQPPPPPDMRPAGPSPTVTGDRTANVQSVVALAAIKAGLSTMDPGANDTADQILDAGASGMHFFDRFLPAYNEWNNASISLQQDIEARYDRERGISFALMRHDAGLLRDAGNAAGNTVGYLQSDQQTLLDSWQGQAADSFKTDTDTFFGNGKTASSDLQQASGWVNTANTYLQNIIYTKADTVASLYEATLKGKTDEPDMYGVNGLDAHDILIPVARDPGSHGDMCDRVLELFALSGDASSFGDDARQALAQAHARGWLNLVMTPTFDSKFQTFKDTCDTTTSQVRELINGLASDFDSLKSPFPASGSSSSAPPATPPATPPASTTPPATAALGSTAPTAASGSTPPAAAPAGSPIAAPGAAPGGGAPVVGQHTQQVVGTVQGTPMHSAPSAAAASGNATLGSSASGDAPSGNVPGDGESSGGGPSGADSTTPSMTMPSTEHPPRIPSIQPTTSTSQSTGDSTGADLGGSADGTQTAGSSVGLGGGFASGGALGAMPTVAGQEGTALGPGMTSAGRPGEPVNLTPGAAMAQAAKQVHTNADGSVSIGPDHDVTIGNDKHGHDFSFEKTVDGESQGFDVTYDSAGHPHVEAADQGGMSTPETAAAFGGGSHGAHESGTGASAGSSGEAPSAAHGGGGGASFSGGGGASFSGGGGGGHHGTAPSAGDTTPDQLGVGNQFGSTGTQASAGGADLSDAGGAPAGLGHAGHGAGAMPMGGMGGMGRGTGGGDGEELKHRYQPPPQPVTDDDELDEWDRLGPVIG